MRFFFHSKRRKRKSSHFFLSPRDLIAVLYKITFFSPCVKRFIIAGVCNRMLREELQKKEALAKILLSLCLKGPGTNVWEIKVCTRLASFLLTPFPRKLRARELKAERERPPGPSGPIFLSPHLEKK